MSSEAVLSGQKAPYKLLVRAVSLETGLELPHISFVTSEDFVVGAILLLLRQPCPTYDSHVTHHQSGTVATLSSPNLHLQTTAASNLFLSSSFHFAAHTCPHSPFFTPPKQPVCSQPLPAISPISPSHNFTITLSMQLCTCDVAFLFYILHLWTSKHDNSCPYAQHAAVQASCDCDR